MCDYARESGPLLAWFDDHGVLVTVDGTGTVEEVARRLAAVVDRRAAVA